jgi:hypothetical protein
MASIILTDLHAPAVVSSAVLDASRHATTSSEGCVIEWQNALPGVVQFQRKDAALPWPISPEVNAAFNIPGFDPMATLNNYGLKITGLTGASYRLMIDSTDMGVYPTAALAQGINLGFVRKGPLYEQGQKILKAVVDKNNTFFERWRTVQLGPPPAAGMKGPDIQKAENAHSVEVKPQLEQLDKTIDGDEQAIHDLCQPVPHVFRLEPAGR